MYKVLISVSSVKPVLSFFLLKLLIAEIKWCHIFLLVLTTVNTVYYWFYETLSFMKVWPSRLLPSGTSTHTQSWPKSMWDIHALFFQGILYWDELQPTAALWTCRKKERVSVWERERDCVWLISTVADYMHILHSHEQIIRFPWPSKSSIFSSVRKSTAPGRDPFTLSLASRVVKLSSGCSEAEFT